MQNKFEKFEKTCFGSGKKPIYNVHTPATAECRDCAQTVQTDARGNCLPHKTGDKSCWKRTGNEI